MLLVVCCSASAEWVLVSMSDEASHYLDPGTLRGKGRIRKIWNLINLSNRDTQDGAFSIMVFEEYDCEEEKSRTLHINNYSEVWANGKTLSTHPGDGRWKPIAPQTVAASIHNFVCAK